MWTTIPPRVSLVAALSFCAACSSCSEGSGLEGGGGGAAGASSGTPSGAEAPWEPDCSGGWCRVPAGSFVMGAPEDEIGHTKSQKQVDVTFTRAFRIQQYEVTQAQWVQAGFLNPSGKMPDGTGDCLEPQCPVGNVTWFDALVYANALSRGEDRQECYELSDCSGRPSGLACEHVALTTADLYDCGGFRLPTEAEWEYAARAGTTTAFYSGPITDHGVDDSVCNPDESLEAIGWYCWNAGDTTHRVGELAPNAWGLYDMSGNANEWVHDHYTPSGYGDGPLVDPDGTIVEQASRVIKGGRFNLWASACRSAAHTHLPWNTRGPSLGLRLVRTLPIE